MAETNSRTADLSVRDFCMSDLIAGRIFTTAPLSPPLNAPTDAP
jgi:hypothetical protein